MSVKLSAQKQKDKREENEYGTFKMNTSPASMNKSNSEFINKVPRYEVAKSAEPNSTNLTAFKEDRAQEPEI